MLQLQELVEKIRERAWFVDCVEMKIGRATASGPAEYIGPGYLRQEPNGIITYKLYPPPPTTFDPKSSFPGFGQPGQILSHDIFYQLEAMESGGRVWRVHHTLPTPHTSFVGGRQFRIVTGSADVLVHRRDLVHSVSSLKMFFFTEERVPGNASTEITTVKPDGGTNRVSKLDTAKFGTTHGQFHIYNRPGMLIVEAVSPSRFPDHFETRIVESLGFVLAKSLDWNVIEFVQDGVEIIWLRGTTEVIDSQIQPPVTSGTVDMSGGEIWRLFDKYLTMICAHTEPSFHPSSRHVFSVLHASAGVITARALALGVAVEGLVNYLFPDAGSLAPTLKPTVKRLRAYLRNWPEFADDATKISLYRRTDDMIGRILDVSAKSKMYALATNKVICERHIKSWSDLRNAAAHGATTGSSDIQTLVDLCDTVTILIYHLIFRAIGYEGKYRDTSTLGWPKRYYRGRPPKEEEIAVAAYYIWKKSDESPGRDIENWLAGKDQLEAGHY